jgi:hypothetical protein
MILAVQALYRYGEFAKYVSVTRIGNVNHYIFMSVTLMSVAAGLYTTLHTGTTTAHWVGFGILFGAGFGSFAQMVSTLPTRCGSVITNIPEAFTYHPNRFAV